MTEKELMKFDELYLERDVYLRVIFKDGDIFTGKLVDFTYSWDNDDQGSYITFIPSTGPLKGLHVTGLDYELDKVEIIG